MEDDDEVTSRKRRRRSIRNLRRKSGVVPFCLNEEKADLELCESTGKFHCAELEGWNCWACQKKTTEMSSGSHTGLDKIVNIFLPISFNIMFWVLKRTVSLRHFF